MSIKPSRGDAKKFYDVLLPFLLNKPLSVALVQVEQDEMKYQETKMKMESNNASIDDESIDSSAMHLDPGSFGDWRSPQRSATSYVR
jgi:hypothetical protein